MTTSRRSSELARGSIEAWKRMDMEWLREHLATDFVHISPFGRFDDRETYLAAVEPMARKSVVELTIREVISTGNRAAIRFENRTPEGRIDTCDWVRVEHGRIAEIRSFYDTATVQKVLSPAEQNTLNGSGGVC